LQHISLCFNELHTSIQLCQISLTSFFLLSFFLIQSILPLLLNQWLPISHASRRDAVWATIQLLRKGKHKKRTETSPPREGNIFFIYIGLNEKTVTRQELLLPHSSCLASTEPMISHPKLPVRQPHIFYHHNSELLHCSTLFDENENEIENDTLFQLTNTN